MKLTPYMRALMATSYPSAVFNAIISGTIQSSWEDALSDLLKRECLSKVPEALELMKPFGENYDTVARQILSSVDPNATPSPKQQAAAPACWN